MELLGPPQIWVTLMVVNNPTQNTIPRLMRERGRTTVWNVCGRRCAPELGLKGGISGAMEDYSPSRGIGLSAWIYCIWFIH